MRFSLSVITRRCWRPATTRSIAWSKSACVITCRVAAAGRDRRLVADVREVGAGEARPSAARSSRRRRRRRAACRACARGGSRSRPFRSGGWIRICRSKRPGRSSAGSRSWSRFDARHHDDLVARAEAVELDEQLVQRLILLAVERVAAAGLADRVELVDEDDRRRVLARLVEQLADPRRAEAGEHLDERRGALRVEARARLVRDRLRGQRLAGAGRAVEEDPLRHARAEPLEALRVAQEVDDLLELLLRLVEPGDLLPGDRRRRARRDLRRLDARHQLHRPPEQPDDDAHEQEEHDRKPRQRERPGPLASWPAAATASRRGSRHGA